MAVLKKTPTGGGGGGSGTVTSVALTLPNIFSVSGSPVTTSGTLSGTLANQNANLVFAGPSTGGATAPAFRSLVAADIPSLASTYLPLTGGTLSGDLVVGGDLSAANLYAAQGITANNVVLFTNATPGQSISFNSEHALQVNNSMGAMFVVEFDGNIQPTSVTASGDISSAASFTLNGDTITSWPSGGGGTPGGSSGDFQLNSSSAFAGTHDSTRFRVSSTSNATLDDGAGGAANLNLKGMGQVQQVSGGSTAYVRPDITNGTEIGYNASGSVTRIALGNGETYFFMASTLVGLFNTTSINFYKPLIASGTILPGLIATGSVAGTSDGQLAIDSSDKKLYRWSASAWNLVG